MKLFTMKYDFQLLNKNILISYRCQIFKKVHVGW